MAIRGEVYGKSNEHSERAWIEGEEMRLIDADKFSADKNDIFINIPVKDRYTYVINPKIEKLINECPTVDAVPVVHAHWDCIENVVSYEGTFDAYECSHCHKSFLDDLCENNGSDYVNAKNDFKYCPFCGAKMDEK